MGDGLDDHLHILIPGPDAVHLHNHLQPGRESEFRELAPGWSMQPCCDKPTLLAPAATTEQAGMGSAMHVLSLDGSAYCLNTEGQGRLASFSGSENLCSDGASAPQTVLAPLEVPVFADRALTQGNRPATAESLSEEARGPCRHTAWP